MQPSGELNLEAAEQRRLELVVNTLSRLGRPDENLAEVAHDARNMVTALGLYCDLLKEPGVLAEGFGHYAAELQLVTAASRRLVDKLATLDAGSAAGPDPEGGRRGIARELAPAAQRRGIVSLTAHLAPPHPIDNLADQLMGLKNVLAALVGPGVELSVAADGGRWPVHLSSEDLTRILVNLVKNSAEALEGRGRIEVRLAEAGEGGEMLRRLVVTVEDDGPGIAQRVLDDLAEGKEAIFEGPAVRMTPYGRRGLGLKITRSIVEAAGGRLRAANRGTQTGARLEIELPVRSF